MGEQVLFRRRQTNPHTLEKYLNLELASIYL